MQQRRLRPGDVLDDYCPRERRITDHAIVAMIDDEIKQTRCVSCDTEHEYKQAKVPPQRRKKATPALFTQVLEGLQGPARIANSAASSGPLSADFDGETDVPSFSSPEAMAAEEPEPTEPVIAAATPVPEPPDTAESGEGEPVAEEGPVRRPLIRAQLPRHEGQPPPTRDLPDFTIRQPSNGRGANRPGAHGARPAGGGGRRRSGGHQGQPSGPSRFAGGQGRSNQFGRSSERRPGAGQGQGQGQGQGRGRPNRGGGRRGGGGKKP